MKRVIFPTPKRAVCLPSVGFVLATCVLNTPPAHALQSQKAKEDAAQQTATVDQVQRIVADHKGERDAKLAQQLSALELTERMSDATLASLEQDVRGSKSRSALTVLADASSFLDPRAADLLSTAPPDISQQRHMMALTTDYLKQILPKLPDFYATRTTVRFSRDHEPGAPQNDSRWHKVDTMKVVITYRDGKEVINPSEWGNAPSRPDRPGLVTWGTFGPILESLISDTAHSPMVWARWEQGTSGPLAVFKFRVPEDQSHYAVGMAGPIVATARVAGYHGEVTAYHGEVAIDPSTGTVLRLTTHADPPASSPVRRADIMVEYGPVVIGGRTYTCPLRSVSISVGVQSTGGLEMFLPGVQAPQSTQLNDVTFADYHQFRAESHILPGTAPAPNR